MRIAVAQIVPAGAGKGVHGIGLATSGTAAHRAGRLVEFLALGKGLAGTQIEVRRKRHRQLILGNGHDAAMLAVHRRNGVAPVALAADEPVAQAELHGTAAGAGSLEVCHDRGLALGVLATTHTGIFARLHERALGGVRRIPVNRLGMVGIDGLAGLLERLALIVHEDDGDDGQVVLASELEVALVAARHGHDGTGAIVGNDVVGHPHGNLLAGNRVHHVATGESTMLLKRALSALDGGNLLGTRDDRTHVGLVFRALDELHEPLVLRREQKERAAEERVGTGGEDGDLALIALNGLPLRIAKGEIDLGTLGAADPVSLHLLHALRPSGKLLEVIQELLSVIGDLEVPLFELALLGHRSATPAMTLRHLLVREHGVAAGAPVDRALLAVDKPALPKLLENPLTPLVIVGVAGLHQAVHIVGEAHALHRGERLVHVLIGPFPRLGIVLDGGVLRRKAEGVEPDGMQHIEAAHPRLPRHGIADGIVARMAHVEVARRIREHLQYVLLRLRRVLVHGEEVLVLPSLLPFRLDGMGIIGRNLVMRLGAVVAHARSLWLNVGNVQHSSSTLSE